MFLPQKLLKKELQRNQCFKTYLQYQKSLNKLDNCLLRISFLEKCRDADIIPKFLNFRIPTNGCFEDTAVHNFQRGLLIKEIGKAKQTLSVSRKQVDEKRSELKEKVPVKCVPSIVLFSRLDRRDNKQNVRTKHEKKLKHLSYSQEKPLFNVINTVKTCDIDINIPKYVLQTLSMGPRSPSFDKFDEKDVLAELDSFLNFCKNKPVPDSVLTDLNVKTLDYIKTCNKQVTPRNITMTKKFLKQNDLLAVPFDKGIGFCIMPRATYEKKLNPIINLPQFEKHVDKRINAKNPVMKEEERVCQILSDLKKENKISNELYEELKPVGSQPPRLYGLAKVHKPEMPLRPIVSMPGSAYHKIAKKVAWWLSRVPECTIQTSTKKVADSLKDIVLSEDEELISFDVTSLYTNVPVIESIEYCADLLFKTVHMQFLDKETFITLAKLSCCNVVFSTHNGYYTQKDGLAMGSPPAPHLANGWLSKFDKTIQGDSALYERYMDDIICSAKSDDIDVRLDMVNNLHPNLHFTFEKENASSIAFLDMLITNNRGSLSSKWFRKPTDTGLTLNYHALAPKKYKRSVVCSFVHRIYRASSSWLNFDNGLNEAMQILEKNQYPPSFVMPIVKRTLDNIISPGDEEDKKEDMNTSLDPNACVFSIPDKDKFLFFLQYRGKVTENLAMKFKRLNAPCKIIMTTKKTKTIMPSLKPTVPKMLQSGVVYQISCPGCNSSYVGQTVRHLSRRFSEHLGSSGTLKKHLETCVENTIISVDNVKVLTKCYSDQKLLTLEALFIKQINPKLNTKDEFKSRVLTLKF